MTFLFVEDTLDPTVQRCKACPSRIFCRLNVRCSFASRRWRGKLRRDQSAAAIPTKVCSSSELRHNGHLNLNTQSRQVGRYAFMHANVVRTKC